MDYQDILQTTVKFSNYISPAMLITLGTLGFIVGYQKHREEINKSDKKSQLEKKIK